MSQAIVQSTFPGVFDPFNKLGLGPNVYTPNPYEQTHDGIHALLLSAVQTIETRIGITGSTDPSSIT